MLKYFKISTYPTNKLGYGYTFKVDRDQNTAYNKDGHYISRLSSDDSSFNLVIDLKNSAREHDKSRLKTIATKIKEKVYYIIIKPEEIDAYIQENFQPITIEGVISGVKFVDNLNQVEPVKESKLKDGEKYLQSIVVEDWVIVED